MSNVTMLKGKDGTLTPQQILAEAQADVDDIEDIVILVTKKSNGETTCAYSTTTVDRTMVKLKFFEMNVDDWFRKLVGR